IMSRNHGLLALTTAVLFLNGTLADEPTPKADGAGKPPWQRLLQGDDAKKAQQLQQQIDQHWEAAEFEQALKASEELLALRQKVQGADHWQAVNAVWLRKALQIILKLEAADQRAMAKIPALEREAETLKGRGRYREEQPLREQVLEITGKLLGEENRHTATSYGDLGNNQHAQGKYAEAEPNLNKALELSRKLLGEEHPDTAQSYDNLAANQSAQGKYAEAERNFHKTLGPTRRLMGEG